jgi:CubicO group peptidase (beta-lactamase class C family)
LQRATLEDLLTMRTGIEWHETDRPLDETNTTIQLEGSEDWIQFTLNQPMDSAPGEKWTYNSGGSHLMSGVIKQATGSFADAYAEKHLFGPLGISDFHWKKTPRGYPDTEGGLYLEAEQLAKIGYLYLHDGVWDGKRILPEGWVRDSVTAHVKQVNSSGYDYGYQWWRVDDLAAADTEVWAGLGYGGQFLIVIPELQMVGVVNSWNIFGRTKASILPAFVKAMLQSSSHD